MKTEPTTYGIEDFEREGKTQWEGVQNFQARNFIRDEMRMGDVVLFYHSNCKPPGVVGTAKVSRMRHPSKGLKFASRTDESSNSFLHSTLVHSPIPVAIAVTMKTKLRKYFQLYKRV